MAPYNGRKPSKILTTHRDRSGEEILPFLSVLQTLTTKSQIHVHAMFGTSPPFLQQNKSRKAAKQTGNADFFCKNIGLLGHKPPYFRCKTSELCLKEVRCFHFSGRKTVKKHGKTAIKPNCAEFAIFRTVGSHGGFRCPSRAIISSYKNEKTSIRKRGAENCTHMLFRSPQSVSTGEFTNGSERCLRHHLAAVVRVVPGA